VRHQGLGDDPAHPPARVEAGIGVLENHLHAAAQGRHRAAGCGLRQIGAVENDFPGARRVKPDKAARDRRFAASGLADQRKRLAAPDRKADPVERLDPETLLPVEQPLEGGRRDIEIALQPADLEQRRGVREGVGHFR